jgi:hypothetical protein
MKLGDGIDLHAKAYGWEIDSAAHSKLNSNSNPVGRTWESVQTEWLKNQKESGVMTVTKEMLDSHLADMRLKFGLVNPEGAPMIGNAAKDAWKGTKGYYDDLLRDGQLAAEGITAPERVSGRVIGSLSENAKALLHSRAVARGFKFLGAAAVTYGAISGYNEAKANDAPTGAAIAVGVIESVNPTPWSSVEIRNGLNKAAANGATEAQEKSDEFRDNFLRRQGLDPRTFGGDDR